MNNKEVIEMIRCLIANFGSYLDDSTAGYNNHDLCKALIKARASIEAWDKVTDELEGYKITGSQMECFETTEENSKEYIPIDTALEIINKHLKEVNYESYKAIKQNA